MSQKYSEFNPSNSINGLNDNTVIFIRHADSIAQTQDFARPLSFNGRKECQKVGKILVNLRQPTFTLSSSAKRCLETVKLLGLAAGLDFVKNCEFIDDLYLASAPEILEILKRRRGEKKNYLVVGHNPGMSDLLNFVKHNQSLDSKKEILPTCGVFVCETTQNDGLRGLELRFKHQFSPANLSA